jgi:hypothetical protein
MNRMRLATVALALTGTVGASVSAGRAGDNALNGTYRVVISDRDLRANGVTGPGAIRENHGTFTWILRDGRFQFRQRAGNRLDNPNGKGSYTERGDEITFTFGARPAPPPLTLTWRLVRGQLRFTFVRRGDAIARTLFTAHPWSKIGS